MVKESGQNSAPLLEFSEGRGRVELCLTVQRLGCDYSVSLFGGDAHVGAVALALPATLANDSTPNALSLPGMGAPDEGNSTGGISTTALAAPGHREDALARSVAHTLAAALQCRVCVVCGMHFDSITKEEIALVLALADRLAHRALRVLGATSAPPPSAPAGH